MADISSLILNHDNTEHSNTPNIPSTAAHNDSHALLAEVQAIKEAIENNESFDFSTLEATAAGTPTPSTNNKSASSPISLNEDSLLIQYRGDESQDDTYTLSEQNTSLDSTTSGLNNITSEDQALLGNINTPETNTPDTQSLQSNLNEDFITHAQGVFEAGANIQAQTVNTQYGQFVCHEEGAWTYTLNNAQSDIQSLSAGSTVEDTINLSSTSGESLSFSIVIHGSNDQATITGQKQASIEALPLSELGDVLPSVNGQLFVADIDSGEARFETSFDIQGSFGTAQINALGEWSYTLNNTSDAVQGLLSGEQVFDLFAVKTLDGSKQLIQVSIQGADDSPILDGKNVSILDLSTDMQTQGSLNINDPDFGESAFQAFSNIQSSLGYGSADMDAQGQWSFTLNTEFASQNTVEEGQVRVDSFDIFTLDGTSQTILIPIQGSDTPFYAQTHTIDSGSLVLNDVLSGHEQGLTSDMLNEQSSHPVSESASSTASTIYMNSDASDLGLPLTQHLNDIPIS